MNKPENRVDKIVSDLLARPAAEAARRRRRREGGDHRRRSPGRSPPGPAAHEPGVSQAAGASPGICPERQWLTRRAALVAGLGRGRGRGHRWPAGQGDGAGGHDSPTRGRRARSTRSPGRWVDVAALADLVEGQGKRVTAGGVGAFLFRRGDTVTAVSSICSHLPCELWWNGGTDVLDCPCHPGLVHAGWQVDEQDLSAAVSEHGPRAGHRRRAGGGARDGLTCTLRSHRSRQLALDRCLQLLEEAQVRGRLASTDRLGTSLRTPPRACRRDRRPPPRGQAHRSRARRHLRPAGTAARPGSPRTAASATAYVAGV